MHNNTPITPHTGLTLWLPFLFRSKYLYICIASDIIPSLKTSEQPNLHLKKRLTFKQSVHNDGSRDYAWYSLRVAMNFHAFCCPCMRAAVLTSVGSTDHCTVHLAVTSRCCRTQKEACAASRDNELCNLDTEKRGIQRWDETTFWPLKLVQLHVGKKNTVFINESLNVTVIMSQSKLT